VYEISCFKTSSFCSPFFVCKTYERTFHLLFEILTLFKESQDGGNSRRNVDCVVTGGDLSARAGHSCVELGTCGHTEKTAEVLMEGN
jgi:hypothetical protein